MNSLITSNSRTKGGARLDGRVWPAIAIIGGCLVTLFLVGFLKVDSTRPMSMAGDNFQVWNFAKSFIERHGFRLNPSMGYPGIQDNTYFPTFDISFKLILWVASIFSSNPVTLMFTLYFVGVSLMYCFAVAGFLQLRFHLATSILCAIVYVVSPYFANRALGHDFLSLYYSVPLGAALALKFGRLDPSAGVKQILNGWLVTLTILFAATSGLYYGFFTCMFLALMAFNTSIQQRRFQPLVAAGIIVAAIAVLLVTTGYNSGLSDVLFGVIKQPARSPAEQLGFGLNIAEAVHVFAVIPQFKWMLDLYVAVIPSMTGATGLFEWPGLFLTLIILLSPILLLVAASSGVRNSRTQLVFLASACLVFALLYSVRGGLAFYFNLFVAPQVRATARIIPFLSFFALVVAATWIEAAAMSRFRVVRYGVVAALSTLLLVSVSPSFWILSSRQQSFLPAYIPNAASVRQMLAVKNEARLFKILQLPYFPWPESPAINNFDPYAHQLPFILEKAPSQTRWSYGLTGSQPQFIALNALVASHGSRGLADAATAAGFDGALIEKQPYGETGWRPILASLTEGQASCKLFEDERRILVALKPC